MSHMLPILTRYSLLQIGVILDVLLLQLLFVAANSASPPAKLQARRLQTLEPAGIVIIPLCTSASMWWTASPLLFGVRFFMIRRSGMTTPSVIWGMSTAVTVFIMGPTAPMAMAVSTATLSWWMPSTGVTIFWARARSAAMSWPPLQNDAWSKSDRSNLYKTTR